MDDVLVVFCKNLSKIILFFVVGGSKLVIFIEQILNSIVAINLGRKEYTIIKEIGIQAWSQLSRGRKSTETRGTCRSNFYGTH